MQSSRGGKDLQRATLIQERQLQASALTEVLVSDRPSDRPSSAPTNLLFAMVHVVRTIQTGGCALADGQKWSKTLPRPAVLVPRGPEPEVTGSLRSVQVVVSAPPTGH